MDLNTAIAVEDARSHYGERRVRLFGMIEDRLHVGVITYRGDKVRESVYGGQTSERNARMRKNPSRPEAENPEWTEEDFSRARPALDVLPKQVVEAIRRYRGQRGPQRTPTKELISLRVDRDVVAAYRATGPGWQAKANEALRAYATGAGLGPRARTRRRRIRRTVGAKRSW